LKEDLSMQKEASRPPIPSPIFVANRRPSFLKTQPVRFCYAYCSRQHTAYPGASAVLIS